MELQGFRTLLLLRAGDDSVLSDLIKSVSEETLTAHLQESLEKMAQRTGHSAAVPHRIGGIHDHDIIGRLLHDGASHHASHYKAYINKMNDVRDQMESGQLDESAGQSKIDGYHKVANQHMSQIFHIANMTNRLQDYLGDKVKVDAVNPIPWQRHRTRKVTKGETGYGRWPHKTQQRGFDQSVTGTELLGAPHSEYSDHKNADLREVYENHEGKAYPLELMNFTMNAKDFDGPQYLNIKDVDTEDKYAPHASDSHPMLKHFKKSSFSTGETGEDGKEVKMKMSDPQAANTMRKMIMDYYSNNEDFQKWLSDDEALHKADPEAYRSLGAQPSDPVHRDTIEQRDLDAEYASEAVSPKEPDEPKPGIHPDPKKNKLIDDLATKTPEERQFTYQFLKPEEVEEYEKYLSERGGQ